MNSIIDFCKNSGIRFIENEPLSNHISFKVGGRCKIMIFPDTEAKIIEAVKYLKENGIKYFIIGNGTNLIAYDEGYEGVILNTSEYVNLSTDGETIECSAGVSLIKICRLALENSLTGLEFAYGIPGTAGGAAYMNAGAYGGEMKDVLAECRFADTNGNTGVYKGDELQLGYRKSVFTGSDKIILSLTLKLKKGDTSEIRAKMDDLLSRRKAKQPLEYPSAGSTFKRPEGYYAGALIEKCGLKGYTVGGASVSEKHAGFVINKGGACANDIFNVIEHCRKTVFDIKGVTLEPEVRVIK